MEHNRDHRNNSMHLWSTNLDKGIKNIQFGFCFKAYVFNA